jgi:heat shock protein HslJ
VLDERRLAMRAKRVALVVAGGVILAVLAASAGCGSSSGGSSGGGNDSSTSAAALAGASWRLTGWSVSSQDPNDFTITAEFKDGRIGGRSAVNQYGGPYTAGDDGSISLGDLVSTMIAGPEQDMRAEQTYLKLLAAAKKFRVEGDALTLSDAQGNDSLIYSRSQASPAP